MNSSKKSNSWEDDLKELRINQTDDAYYEFDSVSITQFITSLLKEQREEIEKENEYKPYFGWCDVKGCENEGCSGGCDWRETGYWTVCMKHAQDYRDGKPQPKMKQESIDRENSRDPETGYLNASEPEGGLK